MKRLECDGCFQAEPGGTYAFWIVPDGRTWVPGVSWLLVELPADAGTLPALARLEIPLVSASVAVVLDGSGSYDPDGQIDRYTWNRGNGTPPVPLGPPAQVVCRYFAAGTCTARLTVADTGTGEVDPDTGLHACQRQSEDQTIVTVRRLE